MINIKIEGFEGPLDLLLHLVSKFEVDIYDVPLLEVIEQYLDYIHSMQTLELEVAGEYLVMASHLLLIKVGCYCQLLRWKPLKRKRLSMIY